MQVENQNKTILIKIKFFDTIRISIKYAPRKHRCLK